MKKNQLNILYFCFIVVLFTPSVGYSDIQFDLPEEMEGMIVRGNLTCSSLGELPIQIEQRARIISKQTKKIVELRSVMRGNYPIQMCPTELIYNIPEDLSPGEYVAIVELKEPAGLWQTFSTKVILPDDKSLWISALGIFPDVIKPKAKTHVQFTAQIGNKEAERVKELFVEDPDKGIRVQLNDAGRNGDLDAGDYLYSGFFKIDSKNMNADDCFTFKVVEPVSQGVSEPQKLCVSDIPMDSPVTDFTPANLLEDPGTGEKILADSIIVSFKEGVSEKRKIEISENLEAAIYGSPFMYELRLKKKVDSYGLLEKMIAEINAYPEIDFAEKNGMTTY